MSGTLLAAAGLASGWMLLWAAAAGIPIAIHFLTRRRQRTVSWAAMNLLLEVVQREAKRLRLEQLIILALRVAILLTLAIALARPYLDQMSPGDNLPSRRPPRLWVIGIDTSYSMGYRHGDESRFELAKRLARKAISSGQPGDAYSLLQLGDPCQAIIRRPTFDQTSALQELRRLPLLDTGCELTSCLNLLKDLGPSGTTER